MRRPRYGWTDAATRAGAVVAAEERCDLTDLLPSDCGCRLHRGGQTPDEESARDRRPGPWFPARYPGTCNRCGVGFEDNQDIRADGAGGWECCDE